MTKYKVTLLLLCLFVKTIALSQTIILGSLSPSPPYCVGACFTVSYTITGTFNVGNQFKVQLSNSTGSFSSPTQIGLITSQIAGTIPSCCIPISTVAGNGFRIRIISSNPQDTSNISLAINIKPKPTVTASANPNPMCVPPSILTAAGAATYTWSNGLGNGNPKTVSPMIATTYTATGTMNGCTNSATVTVNVTSADASIADITGTWKHCVTGGNIPGTLIINNSSSTQSTNTWYQIDWGDGTAPYSGSTLPNGTSHIYTTIGNFNIVVTVSNNLCDRINSSYYFFNGTNPVGGLDNPGNTTGICGVPDTIHFGFSPLIANNPPGTTYTLNYDDGGPNDVFSQPPPTVVSHIYTTNSCGHTSQAGTSNSYAIKCVISNPCGTTNTFIDPIQISDKPIATFSPDPLQNICVATNYTTFTSTTNGCYIDNFGVATYTFNHTWSISPATYIFQNGTNLHSPSIDVKFNAAGIYTVTLIDANGCGSDTISKTLCVDNTHVPAFSLSHLPNSGCVPCTTSISNTSIMGYSCGSIFTWTVSSTSICGSNPSWNFISGYNLHSTNPKFIFNSPGIYSITLTISDSINGGGGCTATLTKTDTIRGAPTVNINSISPFCEDTCINTAATTCIYLAQSPLYSWSFPNAIPNTSSVLNPGTICSFPPGPNTISLSVTNQCGTTSANQSFTANSTPIITATATPNTICNGASSSLTASSNMPGTTYVWMPGTLIGSPITVNPNTTTTYTVTGTSPSGCTATATVLVTVNISPAITATSTPSSICSGMECSTLSVTSSGGGPYSWSNSLGLIGIGDTINVCPLITTTYTVNGPGVGGCPATGIVTLTVNPQITPAFNPVTAICSGGTIAPLPNTSNNGYTGTWAPALNNSATTTYTFTPTSGQCATSTTLTINVNPNITPTFIPVAAICSSAALAALPTTSINGIAGTWAPALNNTATTTYTFTPTAGQCATTNTLIITVNPNITPIFTPIPAICSGALLAPLPTTSLDGFTGTWTPALNNTVTTSYTFTATNICTMALLTITVNPNITPTFNPVPAICSGGVLAALPSTSINGYTGIWAPAINNTATTTYTFTPSPGLCATTTTLTIIVNPTPEIDSAFIPVCSGDSIILTYSNFVGIVPANTTYTWLMPGIFPISSITGGSAQPIPQTSIQQILYNQTISPATAIYTVSPTSGNCPGTDFILTVTLNPAPVIPNTILPPICTGDTFSFYPNNVPPGTIVPTGTTYTWSLPIINPNGELTGDTTGLNQDSIYGNLFTVHNISATAIYTVKPTSGSYGNCQGNDFTIEVPVNPLPNIPDDTIPICSGDTFSYKPQNSPPSSIVPIGTKYTWSSPIGGGGIYGGVSSGSLPQDSIHGILINQTNNTISVTYIVFPQSASGNNCYGHPFSLTIRVIPKPIIQDTTLQAICSGGSFEYNPPNFQPSTIVPSSTTYTWDDQMGNHIQDKDSIYGTLFNSTDHIDTVSFSITPDNDPCPGISFMVHIPVNPVPQINSITTPVCSNETFSLTPQNIINGIVPVGTPYIWSSPTVTSGISGGMSGNDTIISGTLTNTTNIVQTAVYTITPTTATALGNCPGDTFTATVVINPVPHIRDRTLTACSGQSFSIDFPSTNDYPTEIIPNSTNYSWRIPTLIGSILGGTAGNQELLFSDSLVGSSGTATYRVCPTSPPCSGDSFTVTVIVKPTPVADFEGVCDLSHDPYDGWVNFTNLSQNAYSYLWDFGDGITDNTSDLIIPYRYMIDGNVQIILIAYDPDKYCNDTLAKPFEVCPMTGLYIPNAFVPDAGNTGVNNFMAIGYGLKEFRLQIYDAWGTLLWETSEIDEFGRPTGKWDGTIKGKPLPADVYVWKASATFKNNESWAGMDYDKNKQGTKKKVGTLTLIR